MDAIEPQWKPFTGWFESPSCRLAEGSSQSQPLFCRAAQLPGRPQAAPTRAANTAKTQSQQRSSSSLLASHSHHSKTEAGPPGGLGSVCQSPHGVGSPGAAAVLPAVAKIVHFVGPKSAQSFLLQLECGGSGLRDGAPVRLPLQTAAAAAECCWTQWHQNWKGLVVVVLKGLFTYYVYQNKGFLVSICPTPLLYYIFLRKLVFIIK